MNPGSWVRRFGPALLVGAGLVAAAGLALDRADEPASRTPIGDADTLGDYGVVPDFALVERSGRPIRLGDLRGFVWLANFIYTECTETCPLQSLELGRVVREFAGASGLRLVSITVDPDHDTPAVLAAYPRRYQADPERWLFLTGSKAGIYALAKDGFKLGVTVGQSLGPARAFASHGSTGLIMHGSRLVLVDRQGRIRAYHRFDDPESLARLRENLRALLEER